MDEMGGKNGRVRESSSEDKVLACLIFSLKKFGFPIATRSIKRAHCFIITKDARLEPQFLNN